MEKLKEILGQSGSQANIPSLKIYEVPEMSDAERKESLRRGLNITSWDNTFANFKRTKGSGEALKLFRELADSPRWFMLLCYGPAGCGKTHLCEALSIELNTKGIYCPVSEYPAMIRRLKAAMNSEYRGNYDVLFRKYQTTRRLILDDVGMGGSGSSWEWGELEEIINYRYREGLLTVVTTNLDPKDLPDRIVSRFRDAIESRIVLNSASDYRPLKGGAKNERVPNK